MIDKKVLIEQAFLARHQSYSPYSNFKVGAALCGESGKVYLGCNVENAAFTPGNCAERTAFFNAVSGGEKTFTCIAIVGGKEGSEETTEDGHFLLKDYCPPCGVCRQVMMEFCNPKTFTIIVARSVYDYKEYTLEELLPQGFGGEQLV